MAKLSPSVFELGDAGTNTGLAAEEFGSLLRIVDGGLSR
jgi:hypothetical protein